MLKGENMIRPSGIVIVGVSAAPLQFSSEAAICWDFPQHFSLPRLSVARERPKYPLFVILHQSTWQQRTTDMHLEEMFRRIEENRRQFIAKRAAKVCVTSSAAGEFSQGENNGANLPDDGIEAVLTEVEVTAGR